MLEVTNLNLTLGGRRLLRQVSFSLAAGEMLAILGANGAGKSTLLNCLCGLQDPDSGQVRLSGQALATMDAGQIARQLALVPQQQETAFAFTALEMVVMGKTPFLSTFASPSADDYRQALAVLQTLDAGGLAKCHYNRLSGGERQLVLLARALYQSRGLLLLDEPTNHLDYRNRHQILAHVKQSCVERGTAVVSVLHEPNLAQIFADKVLLLERGGVLAFGTKQQVMTADNISRLYGIPCESHRLGNEEIFMPKNLFGNGHPPLAIVTGESGSGKTTLLNRLLAELPSHRRVQGILCPGEMADGKRISSDLIDLASGERTRFGERTGRLDPRTGTRFQFSEAGMALGRQALQRETSADLVVIDEIGPMELGGGGFGPLIAPLLSRNGGRHVWVVRPSLVQMAVRHWSLSPEVVIDAGGPDAQGQLARFLAPLQC